MQEKATTRQEAEQRGHTIIDPHPQKQKAMMSARSVGLQEGGWLRGASADGLVGPLGCVWVLDGLGPLTILSLFSPDLGMRLSPRASNTE